jgi:hypothetical protein
MKALSGKRAMRRAYSWIASAGSPASAAFAAASNSSFCGASEASGAGCTACGAEASAGLACAMKAEKRSSEARWCSCQRRRQREIAYAMSAIAAATISQPKIFTQKV